MGLAASASSATANQNNSSNTMSNTQPKDDDEVPTCRHSCGVCFVFVALLMTVLTCVLPVVAVALPSKVNDGTFSYFQYCSDQIVPGGETVCQPIASANVTTFRGSPDMEFCDKMKTTFKIGAIFAVVAASHVFILFCYVVARRIWPTMIYLTQGIVRKSFAWAYGLALPVLLPSIVIGFYINMSPICDEVSFVEGVVGADVGAAGGPLNIVAFVFLSLYGIFEFDCGDGTQKTNDDPLRQGGAGVEGKDHQQMNQELAFVAVSAQHNNPPDENNNTSGGYQFASFGNPTGGGAMPAFTFPAPNAVGSTSSWTPPPPPPPPPAQENDYFSTLN